MYPLSFRDLYISFSSQKCFANSTVFMTEKFPQQYLDTSLPHWRITFTACASIWNFLTFFQSGNVSLSSFASLVYLFILGLSRTTLPSILKCKVALSHTYFSLTHTHTRTKTITFHTFYHCGLHQWARKIFISLREPSKMYIGGKKTTTKKHLSLSIQLILTYAHTRILD